MIPARSLVRRRLLLALLAVLAISGILKFAGPLYRHFKEWRAITLAREALVELERGAVDISERRLRSAVMLSIKPPEVRLALARTMTARRDPAALDHWAAFLSSPQATPQHFWEAGQLALNLGRIEQAKDFVRILKASRNPAPPEMFRLAANIALAESDPDRAYRYAAEQLRLAPDDREARILLARAGLQSSDSDRRNSSLAELARLAQGTDAASLTALTLLATLADPGMISRQTLGSYLKAHPLAKPFHIALGAELQNPASSAETEAKMKAIDLTQASALDRHAAAQWFLARGKPETALRLLPENLALGRQDFLLTHLDALAGIGDWERVKAILGAPGVVMNETLRHLYLCRVYEETGLTVKAMAEWNLALSTAGETRSAMRPYLLFYAERQGWHQRALMLADQMAEDVYLAQAGLAAQLRLARKLGDTKHLRKALDRAAERFPNSKEIRNDLNYVNLLLKENIKPSTEDAHRLASEEPGLLAFRLTLALAMLRNGRPEMAFRLFNGLDVPWPDVMPHQRAIYAAVLRSTGREREAAPLLQGLAAAELLPEEAALAGLPPEPAPRR